MFSMRRVLSLVLVLFFGLGPLAPMLTAQDDTNLPACCRRHGAHHCAMSGDSQSQTQSQIYQDESSTPAFAAPSRCPHYPARLARNLTPAVGLVASHTASAPSARTLRITSLHSSPLVRSIPHLSVRGPPASLFS